MATWNGTPKKFRVEVTGPDNHWDLTWEDVEFRWEYNTTADCLSIFKTHPIMSDPRQQKPDLYSPDWATAYLYTLASWLATYESPDALIDLLKPIFAKE